MQCLIEPSFSDYSALMSRIFLLDGGRRKNRLIEREQVLGWSHSDPEDEGTNTVGLSWIGLLEHGLCSQLCKQCLCNIPILATRVALLRSMAPLIYWNSNPYIIRLHVGAGGLDFYFTHSIYVLLIYFQLFNYMTGVLINLNDHPHNSFLTTCPAFVDSKRCRHGRRT